MQPILTNLLKAADRNLSYDTRREAILRFAIDGDWTPSDLLSEYTNAESPVFGHLLIEHGFGNAAVLTFLQSARSFESLDTFERNRILGISYNNLVDWHFFPTPHGISTVYVRRNPPWSKFHSVAENPNIHHSLSFDKITEEHPSANIKSLDDALIDIVSEWKRNLYIDIGSKLKTSELSSLFNSMIFVRAIKDDKKWKDPSVRERRVLLDIFDTSAKPLSLGALLRKTLESLGTAKIPFDSSFISSSDLEKRLARFDGLEKSTIRAFCAAFYSRPWLPYDFDFAVISKHALRAYPKIPAHL